MPRDPFEKLPHGRLSELNENPFAENPQGEAIVDETVKTPAGAAAAATPETYVLVQPHRGRTAYWCGVIGLVLTALSSFSFLWIPPLPLLALPFTVLAWWIGRHELLGMRRGLVDRSGEVSARRGYWFGLIGTVLASIEIITSVAFVAYIICVDVGLL